MYSLIIIDMQPGFLAANHVSIKGPILREIKLAQKHNYPIIVVEYNINKGYHTKKYITKELSGNITFIRKDTDDGSGHVIPILKTITKSKNVRLVGVNTNACVRETAEGMHYRGYKVQVVGDACSASVPTDHESSLLKLKKGRKIKILRLKQGLASTNW